MLNFDEITSYWLLNINEKYNINNTFFFVMVNEITFIYSILKKKINK